MSETKTTPAITDWPVLPAKETNRQRIIRALREADGVVPQCFGKAQLGDAYCAWGLLRHTWGSQASWLDPPGLSDAAWIVLWNDDDQLTFAQIADRLEADDSCWSDKADLPFEG